MGDGNTQSSSRAPPLSSRRRLTSSPTVRHLPLLMERTSLQRPWAGSLSRAPRRAHILDVVIKVLAERGYRGATMLEVARRSSASKETLYAWFGNKPRLFEAVIRRYAERFRLAVNEHLDGGASVEAVLTGFGRAMAAHLLGDYAVAVYQAAVSEASSTPALAASLSRLCRDPIHGNLVRYLEQCGARGLLKIEDANEAADTFVGLLLGDAQPRRLLGVLDSPSESDIEVRAKRAAGLFLRLYDA